MAVTDPCNSWGELLRQRKRWSNGYMACRVNFIKKLPGFIANPTVSTHRKIRSATAGLYHSVMLVNDWLVTAMSILLLHALTGYASSLVARFSWASSGLRASFWAAMCALFVQFFICYRGSLSARSIAFFRFSIALQGSVFAVSLCVALLFGRTIELIPTTAFTVAVLPLASLMGHRRLTRALLTSVPVVAITGCFVTPLMWMYAVCNSHDSSWGTKGLVSAPGADRKEGAGAKAGNMSFRRFRTGYLLTWIVINLCFIYVFDAWIGSDRLGAVIALPLMNVAVMLFGLICRASTRLLTGTGADDLLRERRPVAAPGGAVQTVGDSRVQPS
jgi:chitin synthase